MHSHVQQRARHRIGSPERAPVEGREGVELALQHAGADELGGALHLVVRPRPLDLVVQQLLEQPDQLLAFIVARHDHLCPKSDVTKTTAG